MVQVAKIRIMDAEIGDIVNRDPKERKGWFQVVSREVLFNGDLQLSDVTTHVTIAAAPLDVIGVQFVQEVEVPDQPGHVQAPSPADQHAAPPPAEEQAAEQPTDQAAESAAPAALT